MGGESIYLSTDEGVVCRYIINCGKSKHDVTLNGITRATGFCSSKGKNIVLELIEKGVAVHTPPTTSSNKYNVRLAVSDKNIIIKAVEQKTFTDSQLEAMKACGIKTEVSPQVKAYIIKNRRMKRSDLAANLRMTKSELCMILIKLEEERLTANLGKKLGNFKREGSMTS